MNNLKPFTSKTNVAVQVQISKKFISELSLKIRAVSTSNLQGSVVRGFSYCTKDLLYHSQAYRMPHTQMKILIHGLVLQRVVLLIATGRLRAYQKRTSYNMILSKIQLGPKWALAVITILLIARSNIDQSASSIRPRSLWSRISDFQKFYFR